MEHSLVDGFEQVLYGDSHLSLCTTFSPLGGESCINEQNTVPCKETALVCLKTMMSLWLDSCTVLEPQPWITNSLKQIDRDAWWRLHKKRCKKSAHIGWNSRIKRVQQERRLGHDSMHKPYIRAKRRPGALDPWSTIESGPKPELTWKQLKIKKQYMEHSYKESV